MGVKYTNSDYVLIGWLDNDLAVFGHIQNIFVINNVAFFVVIVYHAFGIDRHYHSFVIYKTGEVSTISFADLVENHIFRAHLKCGSLFITFKSYLENQSC